MSIVYRPIGIVHSPFKSIENMPIQPAAVGIRGSVEVSTELVDVQKTSMGSHILFCYTIFIARERQR
jgi:tRNA (Thr-GGU) A37 N-methylase